MLEWSEAYLVIMIIRGRAREHDDAPHAILLPARLERPRHRAAEQRGKLAELQSTISPANCWRCRGTSRPRALAVLRLMTSSNLAGSSIGISDALPPFSSLFTTEPARRHTS